MSKTNTYEVHKELKDHGVFQRKGWTALKQHSHFCDYLTRHNIVHLETSQAILFGNSRVEAYPLSEKNIEAIKNVFAIRAQKKVFSPAGNSVVSEQNNFAELTRAINNLALAISGRLQEQDNRLKTLETQLGALALQHDSQQEVTVKVQSAKHYKTVVKEKKNEVGAEINSLVEQLYGYMFPLGTANRFSQIHRYAKQQYKRLTGQWIPDRIDKAMLETKQLYCSWLKKQAVQLEKVL